MNKHVIEAANIRPGGCHHQPFIAWMGGAEIEMFNESSGMWERNYAPTFSAKMMYRAVEGIETDTALGNVVAIDRLPIHDPDADVPIPAPAPPAAQRFEAEHYYPGRNGDRYIVLLDKRDIVMPNGQKWDGSRDPDGSARPLVVLNCTRNTVSLRYPDGRKHNGRTSELDLMHQSSPANARQTGVFSDPHRPKPQDVAFIAKRSHPQKPCVGIDTGTGEVKLY